MFGTHTLSAIRGLALQVFRRDGCLDESRPDLPGARVPQFQRAPQELAEIAAAGVAVDALPPPASPVAVAEEAVGVEAVARL
eukprot:COSAG01_NODE_5585_length_4163_cov_1.897146_6_plen_82_part_00